MQNCKFTPNHFGIFVSLFVPHTHTPHNTAPHSRRFWFHLFACIFYLVAVPAGGNMIWPPPFVSFFFVSFFYSIDFFFTSSWTHRENSFLLLQCMRLCFTLAPFLLQSFESFSVLFAPLSFSVSLTFIQFFTNGKNLHARYQRCMCNNKMLA